MAKGSPSRRSRNSDIRHGGHKIRSTKLAIVGSRHDGNRQTPQRSEESWQKVMDWCKAHNVLVILSVYTAVILTGFVVLYLLGY